MPEALDATLEFLNWYDPDNRNTVGATTRRRGTQWPSWIQLDFQHSTLWDNKPSIYIEHINISEAFMETAENIFSGGIMSHPWYELVNKEGVQIPIDINVLEKANEVIVAFLISLQLSKPGNEIILRALLNRDYWITSERYLFLKTAISSYWNESSKVAEDIQARVQEALGDECLEGIRHRGKALLSHIGKSFIKKELLDSETKRMVELWNRFKTKHKDKPEIISRLETSFMIERMDMSLQEIQKYTQFFTTLFGSESEAIDVVLHIITGIKEKSPQSTQWQHPEYRNNNPTEEAIEETVKYNNLTLRMEHVGGGEKRPEDMSIVGKYLVLSDGTVLWGHYETHKQLWDAYIVDHPDIEPTFIAGGNIASCPNKYTASTTGVLEWEKIFPMESIGFRINTPSDMKEVLIKLFIKHSDKILDAYGIALFGT